MDALPVVLLPGSVLPARIWPPSTSLSNFALGGLSNPHQYGELAERLGSVFGDFTLEVYSERHHFDPPHRIEPERLATSLREIWARAGETAAVR